MYWHTLNLLNLETLHFSCLKFCFYTGIPISMKSSNLVISRERIQLWASWFLTVALYPSAPSCHTCLWDTKSTVFCGCMVHALHSQQLSKSISQESGLLFKAYGQDRVVLHFPFHLFSVMRENSKCFWGVIGC